MNIALIFPDILNRMVNGEAIAKILKAKGVHRAMDFYDWLDASPNRALAYARAQEHKAEVYVDECVSIADNKELNPNVARNMIQVRQWYGAKVKPKKYGDRVDISVAGQLDLNVPILMARNRTLQPNSNPALPTNTQAIEYTDYNMVRPTDNESAALPDGMPDPFS